MLWKSLQRGLQPAFFETFFEPPDQTAADLIDSELVHAPVLSECKGPPPDYWKQVEPALAAKASTQVWR